MGVSIRGVTPSIFLQINIKGVKILKLIFNNVNLTDMITITSYNMDLMAILDNNKIFTLDFVIKNGSDAVLDSLAESLYTGTDFKELYFNNDDYYYNAKISNVSLEHLKRDLKKGVLEFEIKDSFRLKKAITTKTLEITNNLSILENEGTAKTYPTFEVDFRNTGSYLQISNITNNKHIKLGSINHLEDLTTNTETKITDLTSFSTRLKYTASANVISKLGGTAIGAVSLVDNKLSASDYNTSSVNTFRGPLVTEELSTAINNFRYKTYLDFSTLSISTRKSNKFSFFAEDELGGLIAGIQITCSNNQNINSITLKSENTEIILNDTQESGFKYKNIIEALGKFNNFQGYFEIIKVGDSITFSITKVDKDTNEIILNVQESITSPTIKAQKLKRAGVWFQKFGAIDTLDNFHIKELSLYSMTSDNTLTTNIFKNGSKLSIDCTNSTISLDGVTRFDIVDISNDFMDLQAGNNELLILTDNINDITVKAKYFEKHLY